MDPVKTPTDYPAEQLCRYRPFNFNFLLNYLRLNYQDVNNTAVQAAGDGAEEKRHTVRNAAPGNPSAQALLNFKN
ncbi:hypothetical protein [Noviherbaspirillum soli]|uniref:hypothetical protein n=1 Tax=Noviherbaspirillum soli TaxID=1064518 RepID=UPI00188CD822|nr:hypothetical protein [Noviherbaspirillum soli]